MNIQYNNEYYARFLLREVVLHHNGDHSGFLKINTELDQALGKKFPAFSYTNTICKWFEEEIKTIARPKSEQRSIVFAFIVWGEKYINNLIRCSFSSLLAPENIPALVKERDVTFLIHTNKHSEELLLHSPVTKKLQEYGVKFEFLMLPDYVITDVNTEFNNKYWLLGASQTIQMLIAKNMDADLHVSAPDLIYSENFFSGMLKKIHGGAKAILQSVICRVRVEEAFQDIAGYIKDDIISIGAAQLVAICLNNIPPVIQRLVINNRPDATLWPKFHQLFWEGDLLYSVCQHSQPVYLDREVLATVPERYFMTLDSELEKIIPENIPLSHIHADDDMAVAELGAPDNDSCEPYTTVNDYCHYFWCRTGNPSLLRYFFAHSSFSIDRNIRKCPNPLSEQGIKNSMEIIQKSVESTCPFN